MRSRNRVEYESHGDVHFVTSTVVGFINLFKYEEACDVFVECLRFLIKRGDLTLLAWVLMPNHFHLVARSASHKNISEIIASLKRYTARHIGQLRDHPQMQSVLSQIGQAAKLEPGKGTALWKPRFDNLVITSEATLRQKTNYIHHNTVCKGFVNEPWQWHYSSASCYAGMAGIDVPVDNQWACLGYGDIPSGKDS